MSKILVVGGTSGIGLETSHLLSKNAEVIVAGRNKPEKLPTNSQYLKLDITDEEMVQKAAIEVGKIDGLVFCSGLAKPKEKIQDFNLEKCREIFEVNVFGLLTTLKHFYNCLNDGSKIVVVSSSAARKCSPFAGVEYTSSKYALSGIVRQLSQEFAERKIQINSVFPSMTLTPMLEKNVEPEKLRLVEESIPLGRVAKPIEVANAIEFLLSDKNTYMTGAGLDLNGGLFLDG